MNGVDRTHWEAPAAPGAGSCFAGAKAKTVRTKFLSWSGRNAAARRRYALRGAQAAEAGIRQFLDLGTGLPTAQNTHQVAQEIAPDSRVVYVDNDHCKSGCAHARWAGQAA